MAVFELHGAAALRQRHELVAEADAEHRDAAEELGDLRDLVDVVRRVAGAVGEHDAVIPGGEDILRFGRAGQHRHGAAAAAELARDVALGAVVDERHAVQHAPLRLEGVGLRRCHLRHGVRDAVGAQGREIVRHRVADGSVHRAGLAQDARDGAGVDAGDAGDVVGFQKCVERFLAPEVRRRLALLAHDIAAHAALALKIGRDDAVVADERERLQHDLAAVAGVGECLDVAVHAGGEHQFANRVARCAESEARKDLAVFEYEIALHSSISASVAAMTALMVCMRFSASWNTTDCALSNTSSVTSIASRPKRVHISLPMAVFLS